MLRGLILRPWFYDPDSDGGTSEDPEGDNTDDPTPPPEKKFSQADVDSFVKTRLRKAQAEKVALEEQLSQLKTQVEELNKRSPPEEGGDPKPGAVGELEATSRKLQREVDDLKRQLEQQKQRAETAEQNRKIAERDQVLRDAISNTGLSGKEADFAFHALVGKVEPDQDDEGKWLIKTEGGNLGTITQDVITELLPDSVKPSMIKGTGSGSAPSQQKIKKAQAEVTRLRAEEKRLQTAARQYGDNATLVQLERVRKQIKLLEAETKQTK